jgi:hypothetical protein
MPEGTISEQLSFIENKINFENESERLLVLFETYVKSQKELSPIITTFFGKPGYDDVWDDLSPKGAQKKLANLKLFNETRDWFAVKELTEEEVVNFTIFNQAVGDQYALKSQFPGQYLI